VLFRIDPRGYENKVRQAIGVLARAQAQESYLEAEATRRSQLPDLALSAEQRQNTAGVAQSAKDAVEEATGALDQASLDLEHTTIRSSVNGWVSDLLLQEGDFATAGQWAVTIVNADSFWVVGYFEETQLPRVRVSDCARIVLMVYPDQAARGHVAGFGPGINVVDAAPGVAVPPGREPGFQLGACGTTHSDPGGAGRCAMSDRAVSRHDRDRLDPGRTGWASRCSSQVECPARVGGSTGVRPTWLGLMVIQR